MKDTTIKKIIDFFRENEELFNSCIEELDGYNGFLGDNRYYPMEELNELYRDTEPLEMICRVFYGRDDDTCTAYAYGKKTYGEFNPYRNYFYYNGYGNLVSSDYKDYSAYLDHYTIENMSNNRRWINSIEDDAELSALFDELEEDEEE